MTVGELIKKLQDCDASEEVVIVINTGDDGIPGRIDSVTHNADQRIVRLIHHCADVDADANVTGLDQFMDAALNAMIGG